MSIDRTGRIASNDQDWQSPDEARAEALSRIQSVKLRRHPILNLALPGLAQVPEEVLELGWLRELSIANTDVADIAFIGKLTGLLRLNISNTNVSDRLGLDAVWRGEPNRGRRWRHTSRQQLSLEIASVGLAPLVRHPQLTTLVMDGIQVADLSPLRGCRRLATLSANRTPVSELRPLAGLRNLRSLSLNQSAIKDLEPLRKCAGLENLSVVQTEVWDLRPLEFSRLSELRITASQVADLGPIAGCESLLNAVARRRRSNLNNPKTGSVRGGLAYDRTPAAKVAPFSEFAKLPEPERTAKTLLALRRHLASEENQFDIELRRVAEGKPRYEPKEIPKRPLPPPAPLPAAIEPIWDGDVLKVNNSPAVSDLSRSDLEAALSALRRQVVRLADDAKDETNLDRRAVRFLERLGTDLNVITPNQQQLFSIGHELETLRAYSGTVATEWPDILAARYQSLALAFDNTVRQFPRWREFQINAGAYQLSGKQIQEVQIAATEVATELETVDAAAFVHASLPTTIRQLAGKLRMASDAELYASQFFLDRATDRLAADVLESVNNSLKAVMRAALDGWEWLSPTRQAARKFAVGARDAFDTELEKDGPKAGKSAYKWTKRLVLGGPAAAGGIAILNKLMDTFPNFFGWLKHLLPFFS